MTAPDSAADALGAARAALHAAEKAGEPLEHLEAVVRRGQIRA